MREVFKNQHGQYWISAMEAKYEGKGKEFSREDFDQFLGTYTGVSDMPAILFTDELITAYPDAKIILTTRDEDKWFESMKATIWHLYESRKVAGATGIPARLGNLQHEHVWGGDVDKYGRLKYREHNAHVKDISPKDRFLEYQVQQGGGTLCEFLGKSVPEVDFPRADDWASYKKEFGFAM